MKRLLIVEDSFDIAQRGLIVTPGPLVRDVTGPCSLDVQLRRPDGSRLSARLRLEHVLQTPPPVEHERRFAAILQHIAKHDVPLGTEIWFEECHDGLH